MIPILFEKTETEFTSNGLGRLNCSRCIVTEERNGIYECEFDLPVTDPMFNEVQMGRIIASTHDEEGDVQPFDIYKKSEPINGVVTFYASHISYRLNEITVEPFTALSCSDALAGLKTNSIGSNPFTFTTDKAVSSEYNLKAPASLRGLLAGQENSILDVYGKGEYVFDKFNVALYVNRGTDTDVSIRYGKNLAEYTGEIDYASTYNGVVPFWAGDVYDDETGASTPTLITLTEKYISAGQPLPGGRLVLVPMDLSSAFGEPPTEDQLRSRATSRLNNSAAWLPSQNLTINFVQLWQTEEYKDLAPLEKVRLCDTVLVDIPMYGVSGLRIKIIRVVWDALLERYSEMELGTAQATLASTIGESLDVTADVAELRKDIFANSVISGNTNQHFWFTGSGSDTGAHITEITREEFLADPENGGGNLVARSNGIAIRNGLTELASFGEVIRLGRSPYIAITDSAFNMYLQSYVPDPQFSIALGAGGVVTNTFVGDGTTKRFNIGSVRTESGVTVTVDGTESTDWRIITDRTFIRGVVIFTTAPAAGSMIDITYTAIDLPHVAFGGTATGYYSFSEGINTVASDICAHAEGYQAEAGAPYAHAQNHGTRASSEAQTAMGKYNVEDSEGKYALLIGNGNSGTRSNAMAVAWNGNTTIAGTLTQSSDRRLKEHIEYLGEEADEFIRELKPAHYTKDGDHHTGFYAQDVEAVDKWGGMVGEMNGYKTLGYEDLIAPLVAYCQHLEKRIEALERTIK